jgi:prephenate dehydrogenase
MARLLVIGTGLIGGSFALAMRRGGSFTRVEGYDENTTVAQQAAGLGLIDRAVTDLEPAAEAADAVMIAVPTTAIADNVRRVAAVVATAAARPPPTVFDVGSVKGSVLANLRADGGVPSWFVPSHPMAGSERHGPDAADANLFRGRQVIITPQAETDPAATARVRSWWNTAGAQVFETTAEIHDEMVALTSHLPHLIAYAFMNWIDAPHSGEARAFAGPGLHDFTRIAASDAAMWRQILTDNRAAVLAQFDGWSARFAELGALLRDGRFDELERALASARAARARLLDPPGA